MTPMAPSRSRAWRRDLERGTACRRADDGDRGRGPAAPLLLQSLKFTVNVSLPVGEPSGDGDRDRHPG